MEKKQFTDTFEIKPQGVRYASLSMDEIPVGYWIDKSVGGCGLTHLCLTDTNDAIILMPRKELIKNKMSQTDKYSGLFKVDAEVRTSDVNEYVEERKNSNLPIKILITYHSFALGKLDYLLEKYLDCRIYVDESQFILNFSTEQPKLTMELHGKLKSRINNVSFFSAHPPKREYLPEYIQQMPAIKYTWKHQVKATPYIIDTDKPYRIVTKILDDLLSNGLCVVGDLTFTKVVVFMNSVQGLRKIIEPLNNKDNIAYVVGDTVRNDCKLNDFAHPLKDCTNLPAITIGTTSLISGFDLYDEETLNIVISSSSKEFTLFDKELDVPQAITRQRLDSNPHNNKFIFLVNVKDMDEKIQKLEETYNKDYEKLEKVVDNLNYLKDGNKDYTIGYELYEGYYYTLDGVFYINDSLLKARKYVFEQLYKQYENGYNVMSTNTGHKVHKIDTSSFRSKTYTDYVQDIMDADTIKDKLGILNSVFNEDWRNYIMYGLEKDNLLKNIKEAREFYETKNDYKSVIVSIKKMFKVGKFYSNADVKRQLQALYAKKGLNRKAKSTDLYEFFTEVRSKLERVNGKVVRGIQIIK